MRSSPSFLRSTPPGRRIRKDNEFARMPVFACAERVFIRSLRRAEGGQGRDEVALQLAQRARAQDRAGHVVVAFGRMETAQVAPVEHPYLSHHLDVVFPGHGLAPGAKESGVRRPADSPWVGAQDGALARFIRRAPDPACAHTRDRARPLALLIVAGSHRHPGFDPRRATERSRCLRLSYVGRPDCVNVGGGRRDGGGSGSAPNLAPVVRSGED